MQERGSHFLSGDPAAGKHTAAGSVASRRRLTVGEEARQVEDPASEQGGSHAGGQGFVSHLEDTVGGGVSGVSLGPGSSV